MPRPTVPLEVRRQRDDTPTDVAVRRVSTADLELRADTGGDVELEGYAAMFGVPYTVADWLGDYDEEVEAGAFAVTLSQRADVRFLLNHDGPPLARTASGTLELAEDDTGLHTLARLDPASPAAQTVISAVRRGDLSQMSMAFRVVRQSWSPDYDYRRLLEVALVDVSAVTYAASPTTSIGARSELGDATDVELAQIIDQLTGELRAGKVLSAANLELLRSAQDAIAQVIAAATPADTDDDGDDGDDERHGLTVAEARQLADRLTLAQARRIAAA